MSTTENPEERRSKEPAAEQTNPAADEQRLTVVGIGASAGGLEALQRFFGNLPDDTGMAFVVVTHLDPERESLLPELLQRHTGMPVRQVQSLVPVSADHVYVISPDRRIIITDTHLDVEEFEEPRGRRTPIDDFYRSLAAVHRDAVAVILSGGGTDGAVGVKSVKEQGGLLMVQHPDDAEHDSMPRAAINTGLADVILPADQLAERLVDFRRSGARLKGEPWELSDEDIEVVYRILAQVQVRTGHDFSEYKRSTVLRRIRRRMQLHSQLKLEGYLDILRAEPGEAQALFNDLLIGVTNFFRDREAWQALEEQVIPRLFQDRAADETIRAWSIGCSTGEEAYSLAILLLEQRAMLSRIPPNILIFASDLDEAALEKARAGVYPEAIEADVSQERLERFFTKQGNHYRIKREVRDVVLFSSHSVLRDPPFSRLDVISCRNLLIYLQRDLQQRVFQIFHYALLPERFLFLGSSESADGAAELFQTVDKPSRIFRARLSRGERPPMPALPLTVRRPLRGRRTAGQARPVLSTGSRVASEASTEAHLYMLEEEAPPSALVDETYHVVHLSDGAGRFLQVPGGVVTSDLLALVRPELQSELRSVLFRAFRHNKRVVSEPVFVQFNGQARRVMLAVRLQTGETEENERLALVFFLEDEVAEATGDTHFQGEPDEWGPLESQLQSEVQRLRERLQATTEEYESSSEELKAANEELQSMNEEYRSTTEELETSKEELQSVNEELQTVNGELKSKLGEITRAHSDLENLMASTEIATLFLDRDMNIQRYTPLTAELFNIMPGDRGRPLAHLTGALQYEELQADARRVLRRLVPVEREVRDSRGRWLLVRINPYRTVDDRIEGVIVTFVDITDLRQTAEALRREKEYNQKIVATVREGLLILTPDLTVEFANQSFYELFRVNGDETVGRLVYELGNGQWDIPQLRTLLEEILPEQRAFNNYRVEHTFEDIGRRVMLLNARRLDHVPRILLAIDDVTRREV